MAVPQWPLLKIPSHLCSLMLMPTRWPITASGAKLHSNHTLLPVSFCGQGRLSWTLWSTPSLAARPSTYEGFVSNLGVHYHEISPTYELRTTLFYARTSRTVLSTWRRRRAHDNLLQSNRRWLSIIPWLSFADASSPAFQTLIKQIRFVKIGLSLSCHQPPF